MGRFSNLHQCTFKSSAEYLKGSAVYFESNALPSILINKHIKNIWKFDLSKAASIHLMKALHF